MTLKQFYDAAHAIRSGVYISVKAETLVDLDDRFMPEYSIWAAEFERQFSGNTPEEAIKCYKVFLDEKPVDMEISDSTKENRVDSETYPDPKIVFSSGNDIVGL